MDEEEEKRERGGEGREKRGFFFLTFQRHFLSGQELLSSVSPPFFSLSLPYTSQTPVLNTPLPSEWTGWVTNLKKSQKRLTHFQDKGFPRDEAMGKRQAEDIWEQGEGKRSCAECADDQDQEDRRRFDKVVEQLGPVQFRRLAGQWFAAQGKGDGESGTMARDGGKQDLENDEDMRTYTQKLLQWSSAGQLTHHLTCKLPLHDRAAHKVEEDLRQHVVCAVACKRAHKAKVRTEKSFMEDDLSSMMSTEDWKLVQKNKTPTERVLTP